MSANRFATADQYCGRTRALQMRKELCALHERGAFQKAAIGRGVQKRHDSNIRRDELCWISPSDNDDFTRSPFIATGFMRRLRALRRVLSRRLFVPLVKIECMATRFGPGGFYESHVDRFHQSNARVISFVYFLNPIWESADGGCLQLNLEGGAIQIEPHLDRLVLFESEDLLHEVLPTQAVRCALTGWFSVRA